jgi:RimJ/RimL family protein N-acetyltransferase
MTRAPHERPIPGPASDFAASLMAQLPVLETARLRLRASVLSDFDAWAEILTGPAGVHMGGPFTRDDAFTEFLAAAGTWLLRGHGPLAAEDKATGATLGFVMIGFEPGDQEPELGWFLTSTAEGKGYAAEAAQALRAHAFGALGMTRLVSYIDLNNTRSRKLAMRLGAVVDGHVDGSEAWVHRAVAQTSASPHVETEGRRKEDAFKTSKRGN